MSLPSSTATRSPAPSTRLLGAQSRNYSQEGEEERGQGRGGDHVRSRTRSFLAVFPRLQGRSPHNHAIAGIAVAMKQAKVRRVQELPEAGDTECGGCGLGLMNLGYCVVTGGTDCHIVHLDQEKVLVLSGPREPHFTLEAVGIHATRTLLFLGQVCSNPHKGSGWALPPSPPGPRHHPHEQGGPVHTHRQELAIEISKG